MDMLQDGIEYYKSLPRNKQVAIALGFVAAGALSVYIHRKNNRKKDVDPDKIKTRKDRKLLLKELIPLLRICIPSLRSKEFMLLVLHTLALVVRTCFSLYWAYLDGLIVQALVQRRIKVFFQRVGLWLLAALPSAFSTSLIKYLESKLALAIRTQLSLYAYKKYMQNETYFRVINLDNRLENADQCLTEDIKEFSEMLAHVYSQISKPIWDILVSLIQLYKVSKETGKGNGLPGAIIAAVVIYATTQILSLARPPFGKMITEQAELEGKYRYVNSRLISNSEEIAFYRGHKIEKEILTNSYMNLVNQVNLITRAKINYNMLEGFLMKYVWNAVGLIIIAVPVFYYERHGDFSVSNVTADEIAERTGTYIYVKNLLAFGAEGIERIMLAFKDISELAGRTSRVNAMLDTFNDVEQRHYQQTVKGEQKMTKFDQNLQDDGTLNTSKKVMKVDAIPIEKHGKLNYGEMIKLDQVPVIAPNGDVIIKEVSFEIQPGQNVLIMGTNGCGKSSLFRLLGGLWPIYSGTATLPHPKDIFFVPQRPYLVTGTLRDQIIYPDSHEDMLAKGIQDDDLIPILKKVYLQGILKREGWDKLGEWKDILSGGEKQRVGMARVLYHKPKWAFLDECTSAVSVDVEGNIYKACRDLGITLLTISHRPTLAKHHDFLMQFKEDKVTMEGINSQVFTSLREEKFKLEQEVKSVPDMKKRLKHLCELLGENSTLLQQ